MTTKSVPLHKRGIGKFRPRMDAYPFVETPCVLVKPNNTYGYRETQTDGRRKNAARLALETSLGRPLREGYVPDHLCRVRNCVNPEHLEEVTETENRRRKALPDDFPCPRGHTGNFAHLTNKAGRNRRCLDCYPVERWQVP